MKTNLLIEAETDRDKCGEGCDFDRLYYCAAHCDSNDEPIQKPSRWERTKECLAAEAAAKKLLFQKHLDRSSEAVAKWPQWWGRRSDG
jgi:hypothetical protein